MVLKEGLKLTYEEMGGIIGMDDSTLHNFINKGQNINHLLYEKVLSFLSVYESKDISEYLRAYIKAKEMSQSDFAWENGLSPNIVGKIINRKVKNIRDGHVEALAEAFGMTLGEFKGRFNTKKLTK